MVIGIDIRFLAEGKRTGVEEYALNLFDNLFRQGERYNFKLFANYWRGTSGLISKLGAYPNVTVYRFRYPNKLLNLSFNYLRYPAIDKLIKGCDVFFYPNIIFGATTRDCPVVTTFHDLSFELHPEFLSAKKRIWHRLVNPRRCARRATKIIAVSHSTKADLVSTYRIPSAKIKVVPSGINLPRTALGKTLAEIKAKYRLPDNFVLFFGTLEPRKNVLGVLRAFENLRKNGKISTSLVVAGSPGWLDRNFWEAVKKSPYRKDIHCVGFIDQADKLAVFALADVFVFPSFYEGFGFPPLEAMSVGTPVITSVVSSLPEVVGPAAILVNPYNQAEITAALQNILTDEKLRDHLITLGWRQAQKYSWSATAAQTLEVLTAAARII